MSEEALFLTNFQEPTDQDRGAKGKGDGKKSLKELAQKNPTQIGDPVSLKAETSDTEPTDQDRGAASKSSGKPKM